MNTSHDLLIAYAPDGLRLALAALETLEPIADVQLCSYAKAREQNPAEPDAAICIVTDDESIELAHDFQSRMNDVPTMVMAGSSHLKIEANGFAGRISSSPQNVLKAVNRLLESKVRKEPVARHAATARPARRLTTPFDHILARTTGTGEKPASILTAASRQLAWDLRAEDFEAFLLSSANGRFERMHAGQIASQELPSSEVLRLLKRRTYSGMLSEFGERALAPLHAYLSERNFNVLVPLARKGRFLGWMAFKMAADRCTEECLDDLDVAAQLLTMSIAEAFDHEVRSHEAASLCDALSAMNLGILVVGRGGEIAGVAGATELLGSSPKTGDHFSMIHDSRVREVIVRATEGEFLEKSWIDQPTGTCVACSGVNLADGRFAICWGPQKNLHHVVEEPVDSDDVELKKVLEALPVPVVLDRTAKSSAELPNARITIKESRAIRDCAFRAQSRNARALRLRVGGRGSRLDAVLFYETPGENQTSFQEDINHAVSFSLKSS